MLASKPASYYKLCTEFYDISKPAASKNEVDFYESLLQNAKGPCLEAMCGSGRLLIPLLKRGFEIDGVDQSEYMLESCRTRCAEQGLHPRLYQQSITELDLENKYEIIFIAVGSFQLISDRALALQTLRLLKNQLLPGGSLLLDTFVPWNSIQASIEGDCLTKTVKIVADKRTCVAKDQAVLDLTSLLFVHAKDQYELCKNRYEKHKDGILIESEEEEIIVRWYYRNEMELFLEKAGFQKVNVFETSFEHNPHATVFQAIKGIH